MKRHAPLLHLSCLALLGVLALGPACAFGESLVDLAKERGKLRFGLCIGAPGGPVEENCEVLDKETCLVLRGDGTSSLHAEAFSTEGTWREKDGRLVVVSILDDEVEFHSPYLQARVGLDRPRLMHFASPGLAAEAPRRFEDIFGKAAERTFYACIKEPYATTDEECSETSRQHGFVLNRDGTGAYFKATRKVPARFSWTYKAPVITANFKVESLGRVIQDRYLELDSPYKEWRVRVNYRLLGGESGKEP